MPNCIILDEFAVVRKVADRILKLSGFESICCETLDETLERLARCGKVDVVIVSATLPDQPVERAVRAIRAHPAAAETVILTSLVEADLSVMLRAKRAGSTGFTFRPFTRKTLQAVLAEYVPMPELAATA